MVWPNHVHHHVIGRSTGWNLQVHIQLESNAVQEPVKDLHDYQACSLGQAVTRGVGEAVDRCDGDSACTTDAGLRLKSASAGMFETISAKVYVYHNQSQPADSCNFGKASSVQLL